MGFGCCVKLTGLASNPSHDVKCFCRTTYKRKGVVEMDYRICPFMSTNESKVKCTSDCKLCTIHGECNINNCAVILDELKALVGKRSGS